MAMRIAPVTGSHSRLEHTDPVVHEYVLVGGDRYPVSRHLFDAVRHQLECAMLWSVLLVEEESYTAKELLGDPFWLSLSRWGRGLAGRCLSHLVATRSVPLHKVTRARRYPNKYSLRTADA